MYTAAQIANYFINRAINENVALPALTLDILLFYSQSWYLVVSDGEKLFEETLVRSPLGVTCPDLVSQHPEMRGTLIKTPFLSNPIVYDQYASLVMDTGWNNLSKFSPKVLSDLCLGEPPVANTPLGESINPEDMRKHFSQVLQREQERTALYA